MDMGVINLWLHATDGTTEINNSFIVSVHQQLTGQHTRCEVNVPVCTLQMTAVGVDRAVGAEGGRAVGTVGTTESRWTWITEGAGFSGC